MRYDYWVIRYVPDPIRGEFVNIGVIAGRDDDWSFRRVNNLRRAARLGGTAALTSSFLRRIEEAIDSGLDSVEASLSRVSSGFSRGEAEDLRIRMNNIVQLSEPRPVLAATSEEAADMAYELMVVDSDAGISHRSRTRVVHRLRDAFELNSELVQHVARFQIAAVGSQETSVDFAIRDGVVHQMSQVWAFDVKNTRHLQTQIQAWNYLLGLLRDEGGRLASKSGHDVVAIPPRVDVNAVFTPPNTAAGEAQFEIAQEGWERLGVQVIPASDAGQVVVEAERLLLDSSQV
jgi:hypothetical protein